jgi:hypothetical protein
MSTASLEDMKVPARLKLSALWTSVMFCYVYGDYFGLYAPGKLEQMLQGRMEPLGAATAPVLMGTSLMMAVPALMVVLSLVLPAVASRWLNVVAGIAYTLVMLATLPGAWPFYVLLGTIEVVLTLAIVLVAWRWPRVRGTA